MVTALTDSQQKIEELRREHLKDLDKIVDQVTQLSPLAISYDVIRAQPLYFSEYCYTEMLGGVYITPQNNEMAARMLRFAFFDNCEIDPRIEESLVERLERTDTLDKYKLNPVSKPSKKVVFLPGSNLLKNIVSKELLFRYMFENEDAVIKPHPLTTNADIKFFILNFGVHRVADRNESGWAYLHYADEVVSTTTSELSVYAAILQKKLINCSNFFEEGSGAFYPVVNFCHKIHDLKERRETVLKVLSSDLSGFISPNQSNVTDKVKKYFAKSMNDRQAMKPLVFGKVIEPIVLQQGIAEHALPNKR